MCSRSRTIRAIRRLPLLLVGASAIAVAQVPVDDQGRPVAVYESVQPTGEEDIPLLSAAELGEIVGPIALYPDDLLAIVLPASTYPLQIVQAARFLEDLERDPSLEPDPSWDDSVVALLNYPDVVAMLNADLDWTWRLGEAVVAQQTDVIAAIEGFRDRAYAAGNLKSDAHQSVSRHAGVIEITPASEDTIYVPFYEPEEVLVYQQARPVYHYYPEPCPVYYYPYTSRHVFQRRFFWGLTTAYSIGWFSDRLHVFHHSYYGHPYFGRYYRDRWWYRRPTLTVHNHYYTGGDAGPALDRYRAGDFWRPRSRRTVRISDQRVTRSGFAPNTERRQQRRESRRDAGSVTPEALRADRRVSPDRTSRNRAASRRADSSADRLGGHPPPRRQSTPADGRDDIRFRERNNAATIGRNRAAAERARTASRVAPAQQSSHRRTRSGRPRAEDLASTVRRSAHPAERATPSRQPPAAERTARTAPAPRSAAPRMTSPRTSTAAVRRAAPPRTSTPKVRNAPRERPASGSRSSGSQPRAPASKVERPSGRQAGTESGRRSGSRARLAARSKR